MLTSTLLTDIEPLLKKEIRSYYHRDFYFESNTFGDSILQAARISLLMIAHSDEEAMRVFEDPDKKREFFEVVKRELREPGQELRFMTSLDRIVSWAEKPLMSFIEQGVSIGDLIQPDIVLIHDGKVIPNTAQLLGDDWRRLVELGQEEYPGDLNPELTQMMSILERGHGVGYHDIATAYGRNLAAIYDRVRTGRIKNWRSLSRGNIPFLDWEVNLRETIRYATETYILPYYRCTLENLPVQARLHETLDKFNIQVRTRINKIGIREYLLIGFPEMRNSPHWHQARWPRTKSEGLSDETLDAYFKFRRDYLFRYPLGCRTKEDVIVALNDEERMWEAIEKEKLPTNREGGFSYKTVLYELIRDLDDPMYDIEPWELKATLPKGTFRKEDVSPDKQRIAKYLAWVDERYEIPFDIFDVKEAKHIPHFSGLRILGLTAEEVRDLCPKEYAPWESSTRVPGFTWINPDRTPNMSNVRGYLAWVADNYGFLPRNVDDPEEVCKIPHFSGMYQRTGLSFPRIKEIFNEVKPNI